MSNYDSTYGSGARNIAGIFIDRESAHDALTELHHAGFRRVWLGVTRAEAGELTVESENAGGFMEAMGRFFSGEESRGSTLAEALVAHGLSQTQARDIDARISPGNAVVVVDGENDVAEATAIIEETGGKLSGTAAATLGERSSASTASADTAAFGTASLGARSADTADDARRLQLREERLAIDKQRVQSGEAQIGKRVVSEVQSVDVPVFHEELYIERRPGSGVATARTPIGEGEEIVVPLMQERVDVSKRTVVAEEVAIGKRRVEGVEHVSDSVRHEELVVEGGTGTVAGTTSEDTLRNR